MPDLGWMKWGWFALSVAISSPALAADDPWAASYDAASGVRFIPVELWTGGAWDGNRDLANPKANLSFGDGAKKRITGPFAWTRPGSGETLMAYERTNGGKKQLFVISSRKDGLGRVEDSRYGRNCIDEVKFPLGDWMQGETRVIDVSCNDGTLQRSIAITIEKADFTNAGIAHSLQFHWVVNDGRARGTDMRYLYSPGKGLVKEWGDE